MNALVAQLTEGEFSVTGQNTNKDEFVTCGGVRLAEVDFKTMESRVCPGLFFAGETLDIDGVTGGYLAGVAMGEVGDCKTAGKAHFMRTFALRKHKICQTYLKHP